MVLLEPTTVRRSIHFWLENHVFWTRCKVQNLLTLFCASKLQTKGRIKSVCLIYALASSDRALLPVDSDVNCILHSWSFSRLEQSGIAGLYINLPSDNDNFDLAVKFKTLWLCSTPVNLNVIRNVETVALVFRTVTL